MINYLLYSIKNRRTELMGVAILMVLLYHMYCWPSVNYQLSLFKYGYYGVDMFLLLSGFGLCFSFENHGILTFYKRRIWRLMPIYWLMVLINTLLIYYETGVCPSFKEILFRLTTLAYWGIGGSTDDNWFIGSILLLYFLFPIIYHLTKRNYLKVQIISCVVASLVLSYFNIHWRYDCLISRIPIFIYGIGCFLSYKDLIPIYKMIGASLMLLSCWICSISFDISKFLSTATICPLLLVVICYLVNCFCREFHRIRRFLLFCGKYSFVLYVSNTLTAWSITWLYRHYEALSIHIYYLIPFYIVCTLFFGAFFIIINDLIYYKVRESK